MWGSLVIVIVIVVSALIWRKSPQPNVDNKKEEQPVLISSSSPQLPEVILGSNIPAPSLDKTMRSSTIIGEDTKRRVDEKVKEIVSLLKKDSKDTDRWLELGLYAEVYTDYQRAKEIYEYVTRVDLNGYTAYHNLGNLYRFYLKDYIKAEANMKVVLDMNPTGVAEYISLSDLYYSDLVAKKGFADDILLKGIAKNPTSTDLMVSLARYYVNTGDKEKAREYYQKALALSPKNAAAIKQDLDALGN